MPFTTEIAIFETSEEFRNNPGIVTPAFEMVLKAPGAQSPGYYGTRVEDPNKGYILLNWDSYESHRAVLEGPYGSEIRVKLKSALGGSAELFHVEFSGPTIAFDHPVTQVLVLTLKAPENRQPLFDILSEVSEGSGKVLVFGTARQDENKIFVIAGWPSVEAHWEHAKKPEVAAMVDKMLSLADNDQLYHTKLSRFPLL